MSYSDDSPQTKAAKVSGERRRADRDARERAAVRRVWFLAHPGIGGHPLLCICDDCEGVRSNADDYELRPREVR